MSTGYCIAPELEAVFVFTSDYSLAHARRYITPARLLDAIRDHVGVGVSVISDYEIYEDDKDPYEPAELAARDIGGESYAYDSGGYQISEIELEINKSGPDPYDDARATVPGLTRDMFAAICAGYAAAYLESDDAAVTAGALRVLESLRTPRRSAGGDRVAL